MISNLIVSNQKFVLIVDDVNFEHYSQKFIKKWLDEQKQNPETILDVITKFNFPSPSQQQQENENEILNISNNIENLTVEEKNSNVIMPPLSHLLLEKNPNRIFQLVNQLKKNSNIKQLFLWATTKNISEHFLIPFLEYMADLIVHFVDGKQVTVTTRKFGGLVTKKAFTYEINEDSFLISATKIPPKKIEEPEVKPETLGTFKIDLNEDELIARNALKLPYERTSDDPSEGRIIYTPDADDDFDDEDPDEDLYI